MKPTITLLLLITFILFSACKKDTDVDSSTPVSLSGTWMGTWESTSYELSGTFIVDVVQEQNVLSGTISVPEIEIENASLKGTVNGENISFSDTHDIITFSGKMITDSVASGNYLYPENSDKGTWQAFKPGINTTLYPSDTVFTNLNTISLKGVAFDGISFYIVSNENIIYKLGIDGQMEDSLTCPVDYPGGLTSDGTNIFLAGEPMGMIYRLNGLEKIALNSPGSGQFSGMDINGQDLWIMDDYLDNNKIYKSSLQTGIVSDSIPLSTNSNSCLAFDGENLWYNSSGKIIKIDLEGNILREFDCPLGTTSGLAFSQNYLWIANDYDNKIYKADTALNIIDTLDSPADNPSDLTFEGNDIWIIGYESPTPPAMSIDKAYKISTNGSLLKTIDLPGRYLNDGGLAFGNNRLWYANTRIKLIYKIDPSGNACFRYPVTLHILACDGTNLWGYDCDEKILSEFSKSGSLIMSSFIGIQSVTGMTWDGINIWLLSDNSRESTLKLSKFDANGNILKTVEVYRPSVTIHQSYGISTYGIIYHDNAFWIFGKGPFSDPMKIYKYSI